MTYHSDHDFAEAMEPGCSQQPDTGPDDNRELVRQLTEGEFSMAFAAGYFMQMAKNLLRDWTHADDKAGMLELIRDVEEARSRKPGAR